ncbi:hypothetical protein FNF29_05272 [Cafeteria roenbergensis]|uniref:Thioesterase domain-containing protein n=1 Tax=Cafeteria roenbergensis TaxID=33653 RepID=A0A5A8CCT3_CAFRO|nr:hypothetical protein FNF29_05272 [Cafeteria roenbergensis]KAA0162025.1 hypothetical protein FNF31_03436 [Cafeteria roenbergensis]KAA0167666.1 hypothetical protein FNF28_02734 [Cafeteria roenbergensis]|eukprot:KAA0150469.1 hypothetical protein FNF29_05272 [Cafeteria roenbergensis]
MASTRALRALGVAAASGAGCAAAACDGRAGAQQRGISTTTPHSTHSDHFHVDVRSRLPTDSHFLHGLSWKDKGLEEYDTYLGISSIVAELKWGKSACGHPGIVHGGALAASFDDAFGALFFSRRMGNGFTARLEIDYKRPVPAGTPLRLVSEVDSIEGRKVWMKATLQNRSAPGEEPVVYARSRCLFIVARVPKPEELHAKPEDSPQR